MKLLHSQKTYFIFSYTLCKNGSFTLLLHGDWELVRFIDVDKSWLSIHIYFLCFSLIIYREFI